MLVYYVEINLITIIVGMILLIQGWRISSKNETSQIIMNVMLSLMIMLSISDVAAYWFRGKSYIGIEISNMVFFLTMALGTYAWFIFIFVKMDYATNLRKVLLYTGFPMLVLCVAILLNPLTNYFFTIDKETLLYHRGPGVPVTWIVEWGYMLLAFGINIKAFYAESKIYKKREARGYLIFAVPIAMAAICQMLFYGTTTTQVGYMIALLMVYINKQHFQAQRDDLTGLNNKNAFLNYQDYVVGRPHSIDTTIFMLDVDKFKSINDVYGHLKGDQALRDIAEALKLAAGGFSQDRVILFRYGGDEFVIVGKNLSEENKTELKASILDELERINARNLKKGEEYQLNLSIGYASQLCHTVEDFGELMRKADEAMYLEKGSHGHRHP